MPAFFGPLLRFLIASLVAGAAAASSPAQDDAASRREAIEMMYPVMISALEARNFGRARNICDQAIIWEPQNPVHHYNLACIEAQTGGTRLPYAMGALDLAIALGFNEVDHLKTDPDLKPLHGDPRFADLVRKATYNATVGAAMDAITIPAAPASSRPTSAPAVDVEKPAPAAFNHGIPVGLYFMTRYQTSTRTLEKGAWYFAPDGRVYQNLEYGFSKDDLTGHAGPRGTAAAEDSMLVVTWADGKKTTGNVEREGTGFLWDMGIFTAVRAFEDVSDVAGIYEGGESLSFGDNRAAASRRLELRADGTFSWAGVSFVGPTPQASRLSTGDNDASKGRWQLSGYSLILTDEKGAVLRRIIFPSDDEKKAVKPDRMFFGGMIYKRQL